MNCPSVSIIIPVFNVEPYVKECLNSVIRQTYNGNMECIVVDECGTDQSMAVVKEVIADYKGTISFKIIHHDHNRGLSAARNTGLDAATGDYIYFLDSDDWISQDCIEKLVAKTLENPSVEIVQGNTKVFPETIPFFLSKRYDVLHADTNDKARACFYRKNQLPVTAWNKLIKHSFIIQHHLRFKEGLIYEDGLWTFHLLKYIINIFFVSDITYYYRIRQSSLTRTIDHKVSMQNQIANFREMLDNLTDGYEKEELLYLSGSSVLSYVKYTPGYQDLFFSYWHKAKYHKCYLKCLIRYRLNSKSVVMIHHFLSKPKRAVLKIKKVRIMELLRKR